MTISELETLYQTRRERVLQLKAQLELAIEDQYKSAKVCEAAYKQLTQEMGKKKEITKK